EIRGNRTTRTARPGPSLSPGGQRRGPGGSGCARSNDFADRLEVVEQVHRPAGAVRDGGGRVEAEVVIKRGEDVLEGDGPVLRDLAQPVGLADDLAGPQPAAGQQGAGDRRPVVATAIAVDLGGAAELAPDDH